MLEVCVAYGDHVVGGPICSFLGCDHENSGILLSEVAVLKIEMPSQGFSRLTDGYGRICSIIDVTRVQIQKPIINEREWWEGKDRCHAAKFTVACTITNPRVIHISLLNKGNVHDLTMERAGMVPKMLLGEQTIGDKGYRCQDPQFVTPIHHPAYPLDDAELQYNTTLHKHRVKIEQINKRFKDFGCLDVVLGHDYDFLECCFHAIARMINEILVFHPISRQSFNILVLFYKFMI
jgi:hypothetical protein